MPADPFRSGMLTLLNCSNEKKMVEDGLLTKGIVNFTYFFLLRGLSIVINAIVEFVKVSVAPVNKLLKSLMVE